LTGAGPGQARFTWSTPAGQELTARYAHNEYLQVLTELGVVGLVLVLLFLGALVPVLRRGSVRTTRSVVWPGAIAALVALAIHSGLDFLWHLAVIPLTAGLLVGLAGPTGISEGTNRVTEPREPT
jgi:O-antigen ligase